MTSQFNIAVKGNRFTFNLDAKQMGANIFVKTNIFRPTVCTERPIDPNSSLASAFVGEQNLSLKEEFENDLSTQVQWINASTEQLSAQLLFDACCVACKQHIARCGRLFISDMFSYIDVFAILLNTCLEVSGQQTIATYLECTKVMGHAMNQYVKCPGAYGVMMDFDTWAAKQGI
jgi:hypothetical protein